MNTDWGTATVEFTPDGGVILSASSHSKMNMQAMRLGPSGNPQWAANLYGYMGIYDRDAGSTIGLTDGGAIVSMFEEPRGSGEVTRLDVNGNIVWTKKVRTELAVRHGPDRIAFAGCNPCRSRTSKPATFSGSEVPLRRRHAGTRPGCRRSRHIYAAFTFDVGNSISGYRIEKFQADGSSEWSVVAASPHGGSIVGTDGAALYARTDSQLRALRTTDGSEIWSIPMEDDAEIALTVDTPVEPIVRTSDAIKRLDGQSGSARWSAVVNVCHFYCMPRFVSAGALVVVNGANLERFDVSDGALLWSVPLPATGPNGASLRWLAFGGLVGSQFSGIAYEATDGKPAHVQGFDFESGAALSTIPSPLMDHGAYDGDSSVDGTDVFDLAIGPDTTGTRIRLRRTDAATGTIVWDNAEASLPAPYDTYGYRLTWPPAHPELAPTRLPVHIPG